MITPHKLTPAISYYYYYCYFDRLLSYSKIGW